MFFFALIRKKTDILLKSEFPEEKMNDDSTKKASPKRRTWSCRRSCGDLSPVSSKKIRLEDGCNNNVDSSPKASRWSCSGDTSFVEPEILEEMGVSMLEDEEGNCDSPKNERTQEPLVNAEELRQTLANEKNAFEKEGISRGSSFETINGDRLEIEERESTMKIETDFGTQSRQNCTKEEMLGVSENSVDEFCIFRRKRRPSVNGEDEFNKLSDEMILMILKWLPKKCLVRSMNVCKRWYRIAQDEALWTRLDLGGKVLNDGTLGIIIPRGVQILRLAQAEVASPIFHANSEALVENFISKLQYLDLSMTVISTQDLAVLLATCRHLKKLSLEKCTLDKVCCDAISENVNLEVLNLTMCEGFDLACAKSIVKLKRLIELNLSWCNLNVETIAHLCESLPQTVTRLNLSGCRKMMTDNNIKDLVKQCPDLLELDLSDCTVLTVNTVQSLLNLPKLEHLSLNRCYCIPTTMLLRLTYVEHLRYLDVFGLMTESTFKTFMYNAGEADINKFRFSSIARPTVGIRRTSVWGQRVRD